VQFKEGRHKEITYLIKQVTPSSEFQQHVDSRNVSGLVLQLNNDCIQELEDVRVLERCMYPHLFLYVFAVFLGGSFGEPNQLAGCHAVVGDVDRFQYTGIWWSAFCHQFTDTTPDLRRQIHTNSE
jgi:hypothetical protein